MNDLEHQLDRLEKLVSKALDSSPPSTNTNSAKVHINAGGIGILVILVAASFVLGIALFTAFSDASRMNRMEQRQDRQDDYLQAIYSVAPQLKPKESK